MNETTYKYVKGEGWVPESTNSRIITMSCGTRVLVEQRVPEKDETYRCRNKGYGWDNIDTACSWLKNVTFHFCLVNRIPSERDSSAFDYYTITKAS